MDRSDQYCLRPHGAVFDEQIKSSRGRAEQSAGKVERSRVPERSHASGCGKAVMERSHAMDIRRAHFSGPACKGQASGAVCDATRTAVGLLP